VCTRGPEVCVGACRFCVFHFTPAVAAPCCGCLAFFRGWEFMSAVTSAVVWLDVKWSVSPCVGLPLPACHSCSGSRRPCPFACCVCVRAVSLSALAFQRKDCCCLSVECVVSVFCLPVPDPWLVVQPCSDTRLSCSAFWQTIYILMLCHVSVLSLGPRASECVRTGQCAVLSTLASPHMCVA
jgi:hypothetical protein